MVIIDCPCACCGIRRSAGLNYLTIKGSQLHFSEQHASPTTWCYEDNDVYVVMHALHDTIGARRPAAISAHVESVRSGRLRHEIFTGLDSLTSMKCWLAGIILIETTAEGTHANGHRRT